MDNGYTAPAITELGSFAELTLSGITKTAGTGDTITISGVTTSIPGHTVIGVS